MNSWLSRSSFWIFNTLCIIMLIFFQNCGKVQFQREANQSLTGVSCNLDEIVELQVNQTTFTSTSGNVDIALPTGLVLTDYFVTVDFDINDSNTTPEIDHLPANLYATISHTYTGVTNSLTAYTARVLIEKKDSTCTNSFEVNIVFDLRPTAACGTTLSGPTSATVGRLSGDFFVNPSSTCSNTTSVKWDKDFNGTTPTWDVTDPARNSAFTYTKAGSFKMITATSFAGSSTQILSNQLTVQVTCPADISLVNKDNDCVCHSNGQITTNGQCEPCGQGGSVDVRPIITLDPNLGCLCPAGSTYNVSQRKCVCASSSTEPTGSPLACPVTVTSGCGDMNGKAVKVFPFTRNPVPNLCAVDNILSSPISPSAPTSETSLSWQCQKSTAAPAVCGATFCGSNQIIVGGTSCQTCPAGTQVGTGTQSNECVTIPVVPVVADFVELVRSMPCSTLDTTTLNSATSTAEASATSIFQQQFPAATDPNADSTSWCTFVRVPQNYDATQLRFCTQQIANASNPSLTAECSPAAVIPTADAELNYTQNTQAKKILGFRTSFGGPFSAAVVYRTVLSYKTKTTRALHQLTCPTGQTPINSGTACGVTTTTLSCTFQGITLSPNETRIFYSAQTSAVVCSNCANERVTVRCDGATGTVVRSDGRTGSLFTTCNDRRNEAPRSHALCWSRPEWETFSGCLSELAWFNASTYRECRNVDVAVRTQILDRVPTSASDPISVCDATGANTPGYPAVPMKFCCGSGYYRWYRANNTCP